jgi:hypothetical protein
VEAAARFDLTKCLGCSCDDCGQRQIQASVEAGRFVVPFGAFYQEVGALADMIQNHLLQVIGFLAMAVGSAQSQTAPSTRLEN